MAASLALARMDFTGEADWVREAAGEDMVQDFVSLNLRGMLQPFADHLRSLQAEVDRLSAELDAACGAAAAHERRVDTQEQAISELKSGAVDVAGLVEKAMAEVVTLKREKTRMEGNHEMTKASVAKTKELLAALTTRVEATEADAVKSEERVAALQQSLADADAALRQHVDGRLDKQGRVCKEVTERSAEMMKSCQQARKLGENASAAIKELAEKAERHWGSDGNSFQEVRERLAAMFDRLTEVESTVSTHTEAFKKTDREVQHLHTWTEQLRNVEFLQAQQADTRTKLDEQARRVDRAERDIMDLHAAPRGDPQAEEDILGLKGALEALAGEVKQLLRLREGHRAHTDLLNAATERLQEVEGGAQALASQLEALQGQARELTAAQLAVAPRLAAQEASLQQAHGAIASVREHTEGSGELLKGLRSEVAVEHEQIAKLAVRVDACCKYFSGLGKGLQDTHRQMVSGEGGMLPPSKAAGAMLPAIPRTPRALKPASASSPRRPSLPATKA